MSKQGFGKEHVEALRQRVRSWIADDVPSGYSPQERLRYENAVVNFVVDRMGWALWFAAQCAGNDPALYDTDFTVPAGLFIKPEKVEPNTLGLGQFTEQQLLDELKARADTNARFARYTKEGRARD